MPAQPPVPAPRPSLPPSRPPLQLPRRRWHIGILRRRFISSSSGERKNRHIQLQCVCVRARECVCVCVRVCVGGKGCNTCVTRDQREIKSFTVTKSRLKKQGGRGLTRPSHSVSSQWCLLSASTANCGAVFRCRGTIKRTSHGMFPTLKQSEGNSSSSCSSRKCFQAQSLPMNSMPR